MCAEKNVIVDRIVVNFISFSEKKKKTLYVSKIREITYKME